MHIIESRKLDPVDGFDLTAYIVPDEDATPDDKDCYGADDILSWQNDQWRFVGTIIKASRHGVELGEASLWGSEYGYGSWDGLASPLDGDGGEFVNGYGLDLISEAVDQAKAKIAGLITEHDELCKFCLLPSGHTEPHQVQRKTESGPIPVELDIATWTRVPELVTYADQHCNGDIPEAIKRLVNSGLSHR